MRWGILVNLAMILVVSGVLLFIVFTASVHRALVDDKVKQAGELANLIEHRIETAGVSRDAGTLINFVCERMSGVDLALYDYSGSFVRGCRADRGLPPPDLDTTGRQIMIVKQGQAPSLMSGEFVVCDVKGYFPLGIRAFRLSLTAPPLFMGPAWRFFGAYLILTQAALFLLGYLLFHRTIMGPIRGVAKLASTSAGIADSAGAGLAAFERDDITKIAASLRAMIVKIVDDREKMEQLVKDLQSSNKNLAVAQQGLIRSEKMAAVGRLASGLAHEIGNPLQIVMGYVELLQRGAASVDRDEILNRMGGELTRIHDILTGLLEFARPAKDNVSLHNINDLIRDVTGLIMGRKGFRHVRVDLDLQPELQPIPTEAEKIRQILVNLIFNAGDAMPGHGGRIVLRTIQGDGVVQIQVEDNGHGIDTANQDRIFDPFFTTKDPGKGTGLGLAVCLSLSEALGGSLDVSSSPGKGTTVTLVLPEQGVPSDPPDDSASQPSTPAR